MYGKSEKRENVEAIAPGQLPAANCDIYNAQS